jgi:adenylate cyclase class IV
MGKHGYADADRASFRTTQRRRERDIEFLAKVRALTDRDEAMRLLIEHHDGPAWKRVAIKRAIARIERKEGSE